MHPSDDVLAAIALGEAENEGTRHLQDCARCRAMVAELTELIERLRDPEAERLVAPSAAVWTAISAVVDSESRSAPAASGVDAEGVLSPSQAGGSAAEPDLPNMAEQGPGGSPAQTDDAVLTPDPPTDVTPIRTDLPTSSEPQPEPAPAQTTGWTRRAWLVGGVAAGVLVGLAASQLPRWLEPQPPVVANAQLETLDTHVPGGQATVTGRGAALDLTLRVQPLTAGAGFLEVWLINTDLQRMVSVGVLPDGVTQQEFTIASKLIDQGYTIVDISREQFDDQATHSGDSLLRGQLS